MRDQGYSRTARKVAINLLSLAQRPGWRERLGAELVDAVRDLLRLSGVASERMLRAAEHPFSLKVFDAIEPLAPAQLDSLGLRKIYFEERVRESLEAGAQQQLVLGAGFDTLAFRLAKRYADRRFFEIDHPATAQRKRRGIEAMGRPSNLQLLAADLGEVPLAIALEQAEGWDPNAPSVICLEGLTMYLSRAENLALLRALFALTGPGSRVVLTHVRIAEDGQLGFGGFAGKLSRWSLKLMGEPWRWGTKDADLPAFTTQAGWHVQTELSTRGGVESFATLARDS